MKVLLFDYDGTVLDTVDVAWKAFNEAAAKSHIPLLSSVREFTNLYHFNFYDSLKNCGVPADKKLEFVNNMRQAMEKRESQFKVFPGLTDILPKLAEKSDMHIITSNFTDFAKMSLKRKNITCFKQVVGGDKETSKIVKIQAFKDQYPEAEIYYIGDTVSDINEAKKAEVKAVAVTWGYHNKQTLEKAKPDMLIEKAEDLLELI